MSLRVPFLNKEAKALHRINWPIVFKRWAFVILLYVLDNNESDVFEYSKAETPFPNHFNY